MRDPPPTDYPFWRRIDNFVQNGPQNLLVLIAVGCGIGSVLIGIVLAHLL
jgi:hypothetical protein